MSRPSPTADAGAEAGARPRVQLLPERQSRPVGPLGPLGSVQEAEVVLTPELLERLWSQAQLERLARAYWEYLSRISLGLLRVAYGRGSRSVVLVHRRLVLLRFRGPTYDTGLGFGQVTWPIERGLLVAARGRGHLRIRVRRLGPDRVLVRAEVENFYPLLRGSGPFARMGARVYAATQLRLHVLVTRGFLRSLADLQLSPAPGEPEAPPQPR